MVAVYVIAQRIAIGVKTGPQIHTHWVQSWTFQVHNTYDPTTQTEPPGHSSHAVPATLHAATLGS